MTLVQRHLPGNAEGHSDSSTQPTAPNPQHPAGAEAPAPSHRAPFPCVHCGQDGASKRLEIQSLTGQHLSPWKFQQLDCSQLRLLGVNTVCRAVSSCLASHPGFSVHPSLLLSPHYQMAMWMSFLNTMHCPARSQDCLHRKPQQHR